MMNKAIPADVRQQAVHWLSVCPVHLIADRDTLLLAPTAHLSLSLNEAQALAEAFNQHFSAVDGYHLYVAEELSWFLGMPTALTVHFPSLDDAIGMNLRDAWQKGKDAQRWRSLLNETQMLWFSSAVNQRREEMGLLAINGLWITHNPPWWQFWRR